MNMVRIPKSKGYYKAKARRKKKAIKAAKARSEKIALLMDQARQGNQQAIATLKKRWEITVIM